MNSETQQWYGMYGFVARVLEEASSTAKKRLGLKKSSSKKQGLDVRVIDTNEWQSLDEIGRMEMLTSIVHAD